MILFKNIKNIILKADSFYDSSFEGIKDIPLNSRFSIIVARRVYRHIGKKILIKKILKIIEKLEKFMFLTLENNSNAFFIKRLNNTFFFKNKNMKRKMSII